ncbi:LysR family transcriptional regulator [Neptuniibacter sp. PT34_22]|uniref:LysR family transcriptional regulator n=1 Tax=Neptuniibacter sp. PT34_22 TaxID=3398205 RepID=UPI0039F55A1D
MLDVSDITLLKTVAEEGSISKAAEKLHMSQPTLSKKIARLEKVLKVELFHRQSTGMNPTAIASYLIESGEQLRAKLDTLCRHVELLSNLEGGTLKIGVSPIVEQLLFPKVLMDFVEESNNVEISFKVDLPQKIPSLVLNGEIDIGIGPALPQERASELVIRKVQSARIVFVVRDGHPLTESNGTLPTNELNNFPGIGPSVNKSMSEFLQENDVYLPFKITCDNYQIAKSIVMTSDYFTGGPRELFIKELDSGELVQLDIAEEIPWQSYCITRQETEYAPAVKKFIQILKQYSDA